MEQSTYAWGYNIHSWILYGVQYSLVNIVWVQYSLVNIVWGAVSTGGYGGTVFPGGGGTLFTSE